MKVTLANEKDVTKYSWQAEFQLTIPCHKCGETSRLAFVAHEGIDKDGRQNPPNQGLPEKIFVCHLSENKRDEFWPHDVIACATYFCTKCYHASTEWNQG